VSKLPRTRTWYTKELLKIAKNCAKERDRWICQKCGAEVSGRNAHGSHVLNVGGYKYMELDPNNIKCLCQTHHMRWWHKDPTDAGTWFKKRFPVRWRYLKMMRQMKLRITTVEMHELWEGMKGKDVKEYGVMYAELIEQKLKEQE